MLTHNINPITPEPYQAQKEVISRSSRQAATPPADPHETKLDSPSGELRSQSPLSGKVTSKPPVAPTQASGSSGTIPEVTLPLLATPPSVQPSKKSRGPSQAPATAFYPRQDEHPLHATAIWMRKLRCPLRKPMHESN